MAMLNIENNIHWIEIKMHRAKPTFDKLLNTVFLLISAPVYISDIFKQIWVPPGYELLTFSNKVQGTKCYDF